jgi:hypothetical protein
MKLHRSLRLFVLCCALALFAATAGEAAAATIRYASPAGLAMQSECTDSATPCTLPVALQAAAAGDTLSLANGSYNVGRMALPPIPLHWVPTDPQSRPIITSPLAIPTLDLTSTQSGSSFEGLEIDNTDITSPQSIPALLLETGVAATVRSSVLNGTRCVEAPMSGPLTIDDSTLSTTRGNTWCLNLGTLSTVRHSTIGRSQMLLPELPSPVVRTQGLVEDSQVAGGLWLTSRLSVARRVTASGARGIFGEGLVVDSLAQSFGRDQGAITSEGGGTLRVVNSTAISANGPALVSRSGESETALVPNDLVVTNSIARGKTADMQAETDLTACIPGDFCEVGLMHIDHSDFATRAPLVTAPDALAISEGAGNISGDPRFVNPAKGDFHLAAGSPAIDAGAAVDLAFPTDLDGSARVQGARPDLGAFETGPPPTPAGTATVAGQEAAGIAGVGTVPDRTAPVLGPVRVSQPRFRVANGSRAGATRRSLPLATTVTTSVSEAGPVSFAVQQAATGRRDGGACVARTHALRHAAPCTRWIGRGPVLTRRAATAGKVSLTFSGRLGTKRLAPGRYRFAVSAADAAGNHSATRFAAFTIDA